MIFNIGYRKFKLKKGSESLNEYNQKTYSNEIDIDAARYNGIAYVKVDGGYESVSYQTYQTEYDVSIGDILDGRVVNSVVPNFDINGSFMFNVVTVV